MSELPKSLRELPTVGDTAEHVWLMECLDRGFPEVGDRISADINTIGAMCRAEPKAAQVAMQRLACDIRRLRGARDADDEPTLEFFTFALGVIYTVYGGIAVVEGWMKEAGVPPELEMAVQIYPEILECAEALGPI